MLEASYEATLLFAVIIAARPGGSKSVLPTLLGGGAFGNRREWFLEMVRRASDTVYGQALDVYMVSHGQVPDAPRRWRPTTNLYRKPCITMGLMTSIGLFK